MVEKTSDLKTLDKKHNTIINTVERSQQQKNFRLWLWLKDIFLVENRVEKLEGELSEIINNLPDLNDQQRKFLRVRWLGQVLWWENKATSFRNKYNFLRMLMIIGGATVTALVSLQSTEYLSSGAKVLVQWSSIILSLLVTISAALEGVFQLGERRRHKRKAVELLKSEGWQFFQLSGRYQHYGKLENGHAKAYAEFAARVEDMTQREIEEYISIIQEPGVKKEGLQ